MKRLFIMALAVGVMAVLFAGLALNGNDASAAPKEVSPFVGEWEAIDPLDGSYMQMKITGHHEPKHGKLVDDFASLCPEGGPATVIGKVTYSDPFHMEAEARARCHVGNYQAAGMYMVDWFGSDMLIDWDGVIWTRLP